MASSKCAVTTRTPNLLDVILDGSWHIEMNDGLNVTLVDSHGESNCAAQNTRLILDELLLDVISLLISLTCVVRCRRDTVLIEIPSNLIGCPSLCCE